MVSVPRSERAQAEPDLLPPPMEPLAASEPSEASEASEAAPKTEEEHRPSPVRTDEPDDQRPPPLL
jgi:hypothetical protein